MTQPVDPLRRRSLIGVPLVLLGALAGCAAPPPPPPPPAPPPPPPPEPVSRNRLRFEDGPDGARAILPNSILFEFGKSDLSPDAGPVLDLLKPAFDKARGKIIVEGHTDSVGTDAANKQLSVARADKVRAAILARQIPPNRLEIRGLGKDKPRYTPEVNDEDRAGNRRAEILFPGETVESLGGRQIEDLAKALAASKGKS
ncbi:MAG: OmpA family protein [Rubrivivax sp.]